MATRWEYIAPVFRLQLPVRTMLCSTSSIEGVLRNIDLTSDDRDDPHGSGKGPRNASEVVAQHHSELGRVKDLPKCPAAREVTFGEGSHCPCSSSPSPNIQRTDDKVGTMSGFGRDTTTDEVLEGLDLSGRRFVITGAASGLGRESARALAAHGASVTLLARSHERAVGAVEEVAAMVPGADLEAGVADLSDLSSIREFADSYLRLHDTIDVMMNNAGVMACPLGRTVDGFETQFGTNHLGHFLLTALLYPAIRAGERPRVVTLTSSGHSRSDVDLQDPNFERTEYSAWVAYGRAKTANALFARELARRAGPGLLSFAVHPGGIVTELGRHLNDDLLNDMIEFARSRSAATNQDAEPMGIHFKSVEAGAATQVWAATGSELAGNNGAYLADCGLGVLGGDPGVNGFMPYLMDDEHAAALWELSEQLVGQHFDP